MKVLIVGLGYAGGRYLRAFEELRTEFGPIEVAHVSRSTKDHRVPGYQNLPTALLEFVPDLVVVTVNDVNRAEVLPQLAAYDGPILCEKPLLTASDDLVAVADAFGERDDFYVAQIERYSQAAVDLKRLMREENLKATRASFFWAKNRIGDPRPTSGVISEAIHPIDLIQWLIADGLVPLAHVSGSVVSSDFSISGNDVVDTALLTGRICGTAVAGYASFVGLERMRTVQMVLTDGSPSPVYATATFDSPVWDADRLHVWRLTERGEQDVLLSHNYEPDPDPARAGLHKQIALCRGVLLSLRDPAKKSDLPGIGEAMDTQRVLNSVAAGTGPSNHYFPGTDRFRLCQGPVGTAQWRSPRVPADGHEFCPVVAVGSAHGGAVATTGQGLVSSTDSPPDRPTPG